MSSDRRGFRRRSPGGGRGGFAGAESRSAYGAGRFRARKALGQHFLHDPAVIRRIVDTIDPRPEDALVEIGGGLGALTAPLLERLAALHVVEVDPRLGPELERLGSEAHRVVLHAGDALQLDFGALAHGPHSLRVAGNLPYNISTPLLFHLLRYRTAIRDMHLMLQKEVVARMTAAPGGKDYGRLTVMLAPYADIEACFDIGPGAFSPPPRVWSTLVRMTPLAAPRFPIADEAAFAGLVARLFSMRRKTIARALKGRLSAEQIAELGLDPRARPETLSGPDFARLADAGG
ncbi:MAG TPA: 16S rRNA (adenine(1518)-N(6)/adenine(1519)-N(6))-dimethyltransferase RsmA [Gammaproteobacteria bacterium]|nr:16S rRNA (adenine(1518)-N(6)/adenine(1519)-N(6))-dimethyltransferase RsmA [Gammaproteobacteria bacterium]